MYKRQALYDSFEVERVVKAAVLGKKQSEIDIALFPVADRLLKRYQPAQAALKASEQGSAEADAAKKEMDVLILFKRDIGTCYVRPCERPVVG